MPGTKPPTALSSNPPTSPASSSSAKRDFILAQPVTMPAKQVVAEARKAGFSVSESYIYHLRTLMVAHADATPTPRKPGRPKGSKNKATALSVATSSAAAPSTELVFRPSHPAPPASTTAAGRTAEEATFRRLVVLLGLTQAMDMVNEVRQRLEDLVAGDGS